MQNDIVRTTAAVVAVLCFGGTTLGDTVALAPYVTQTKDVTTGTIEQDAPVRLSEKSVLYKTGKGTWSVPVDSIAAQNATIGVRQGTLALTPGGTSKYPTPTDVLNRAALWLDATSPNVITTNGTDGLAYVTAWRDVRETKTSVPYDYLRALPRYTASVEKWATNAPPIVRKDGNGNNVIYFGRYRSGRWMALAGRDAADGSSPYKLNGIRHAFIVYCAVQNYWFLMSSSTSGSKQCWHPGGSGAQLGVEYCASNYEDDYTLPTKQHFLNGSLIDPLATRVSAGMRLLEHKYTVTLGSADALANCSSTTGTSANTCRQGGDDYCEIVIFTEELTEAERFAVEDYLMDKWSLARADTALHIEAATGATVEVQAGATFVEGAGTMTKTGSGRVVLLAAGDEMPSALPVTIADGSVTIRDEVPVSVAGGKTVSAARAFDGTDTSVSEGAAGVLAKTGVGRLRLESIPAGTTKLLVNDGELTLAVTNRSTGIVAAPSAEGTIESPSFEGDNITSGPHWGKEAETNLVGWTSARDVGQTADYYAGIYNGTLWVQLKAYSGTCFGQIRGLAYLYADVEIPEDGFYELSFQFAQRFANRSTIDVQFGPVGSLQTVARVFNTFATAYRPVTVSLPYVRKGTYRVRFHGINNNNQSSGVIDDVRVVRCAHEESVVKVPYGDFEVTASRGYSVVVDNGTPQAADAPEGWTITPNTNTLCTATIIGATNDAGRTYSLVGGRDGGRAQLIMGGSTQTATTTFVPDAFGRFRVRADLGHYASHALISGVTTMAVPQVRVVLTVKGDETTELDLGVLTVVGGSTGPMMKLATCPTVFEIPADATSVTLALHNQQSDSIALIDNVEFIRVSETDDELVRDGGFEESESPDWTFVRGPKYTDGSYGEFACRLEYSDSAAWQGYAQYAGLARLRLWNTCWAYQSIAFTEAGDYQLRFHAAMRMDNRYEPGRKGYEPFCAYLAAGGMTNVIGKSVSTTTNYIAHCWRFRVDKPGTYDFGFQGSRRPDEAELVNADRTVFIDGVSIRKIPSDEAATPAMPQNLVVEVADSAQLRLDFAGTNRIEALRIGGHRVSGVISSARFPDQVFGTGALYAEPKGVILLVK